MSWLITTVRTEDLNENKKRVHAENNNQKKKREPRPLNIKVGDSYEDCNELDLSLPTVKQDMNSKRG